MSLFTALVEVRPQETRAYNWYQTMQVACKQGLLKDHIRWLLEEWAIEPISLESCQSRYMILHSSAVVLTPGGNKSIPPVQELRKIQGRDRPYGLASSISMANIPYHGIQINSAINLSSLYVKRELYRNKRRAYKHSMPPSCSSISYSSGYFVISLFSSSFCSSASSVSSAYTSSKIPLSAGFFSFSAVTSS